MSAKRNFIKQMTLVSGLTFLSRMFGFIRESMQAAILGIGTASDMLAVAIKLPTIARKLTSEGLFNAAFVPVYHKIKTEHGLVQANIWASNMLYKITVFSMFLTLFTHFFAAKILLIIAPGFACKNDWNVLLIISRIMFASIVGSTISSFINTIWTANHKYFMASIGSTICNITIIIASIFATNIYHLSIAVTLGSYVQLILTIYPLREHLYFQKSIINNSDFMRLLLPLIGVGLLMQILTIVSTQFGSFLPSGQFTYFHKGEKMLLVPISLIGITLNTILIPALAKKLHYGYIVLSMRIGILLSCCIGCTIYACGYQIACLAYLYGKVNVQDIEQIAQVVKILVFGMPAWIIIKILQGGLSAVRKTHRSMIGNVLQIIMYTILGLSGVYSAYTLALVSICSSWSNALFLLITSYRLKLVRKLNIFTIITTIYTLCILGIYSVLPTIISSISLLLLCIKIIGDFVYFGVLFGLLGLFFHKYKM